MQEERWRNASIVVCDNVERHAIDVHKLRQIARHRGVPIVRWKRDITKLNWSKRVPGSTNTRFDSYFEQLYDKESALREYFVQDVNCMILLDVQRLP